MSFLIILPFFLLSCCSGQEYKCALKISQIARWSWRIYHHSTHRMLWSLLDILDRDLPRAKPNSFLWEAIDKCTLECETDMAENNSLDRFRMLVKNTTGIEAPSASSMLEPFLASNELLAVLDPQVPVLLINRLSKTGKSASYGESLLEKVTPSLKRIYVANAYLHFKAFFIFQVKLSRYPNAKDIMNPLNYERASTHVGNLRNNIALLRSAIPKLSTCDGSMMVLLLCTTRSLAQYLSYISRFYPPVQHEVYAVLDEYNKHLSAQMQINQTETHIFTEVSHNRPS